MRSNKFKNKNEIRSQEIGVFNSYLLIWESLKSRRKKQLLFLFLLMIISGILEIITLKLFLPVTQSFISFNNFQYEFKFLNSFQNLFNINNPKDLQVILISSFVIIIFFSTIIKLSTLWLNEKVAALIGNDISNLSFSVAIRQPYSVQINRNSSNIIATMLKYTDDYVSSIRNLLKFS